MSKKLLPLFTLLLVSIFTFTFFYPQKTLGANDHVVISQIQISGATGNDEFVELFNPTASTIDLSTYKLTRKNSIGTEGNLVASLTGTINPGGYFLIGHGVGYEGTPTLDKIYSAPSNALTNNYTVLLYSSNVLVDKVGFGSAADFEGAAFSINPAADSSIQRINNQDTDNNNIDFVVINPSNARNSGTVVNTSTPIPTSSPTTTPNQTETPMATASSTPTSTPVATLQPTNTPIPTETSTSTPEQEVSPTPTSSSAPTVSPTQLATASPTKSPKPSHTNKPDRDYDHEFHLPFGFRCGFERHEVKFKKVQFSYYKFHFGRR